MATVITAGNATNGLSLSADNAGTFEFKTGTGAGTSAMTIDSSQNVGIGTSSPSAKLDLYNGGSQLKLNMVASGNGFAITNDPSYTLFQTANAVYMGFGTNGTERMRLDSSGNLLVGATAQYVDSGHIVTNTTGATFGIAIRDTASTTGGISFINSSNTRVGAIFIGASNTTYSTSSDYRLKEDVQPMTGALAKVSALKPVTYKWKADGSDGQGFIAHELQAVVPDAVVGEKDAVDEEGNPKYQGVDTSFLVATLTAAIQELSAKVAALEAIK